MTFDLEVEFVVKALVVTVRDGHVVSLHTGACDVAATLAAEGIQLASRKAHFELPLVVRWPLLLRLGGGSDPLPTGPSPLRHQRRRRPGGERRSATPCIGSAAAAARHTGGLVPCPGNVRPFTSSQTVRSWALRLRHGRVVTGP